MGIVLKNGKIVTATDSYFADIRIEDDLIVATGCDLCLDGDEVIDVTGCYVLPGGIDTHTHFDLDVGLTVTADNFYTGTKAALIGGTTSILDYATQKKGESLTETLKGQFDKTREGCFCDFGFHMGITDWNDQVSLEMNDMIKAGVTSFKLYMAYKNNLQVDDDILFKALIRSKEVGGLIGFHCENGDVIDVLVSEAKKNKQSSPIHHALTRPVLAEKEAISRLLSFAELCDVPVNIVHLSSKEGLLSILDAKKRGVNVTVETCPQYLLLDDSYYQGTKDDAFAGAKVVMSPPLRKLSDQKALWHALQIGDITTIGTDHCSFNYKGQKDLGFDDFSRIPNGAPGCEHRMSLMYTYGVLENKLSMNQFVALTSTNAAKLFGLFPRKGTLAVGSEADIIVWDPQYESVIEAKSQTQQVDYTPYEGFNIKGRVMHAFLRGKQVIHHGVMTKTPTGRYLHRLPITREDLL